MIKNSKVECRDNSDFELKMFSKQGNVGTIEEIRWYPVTDEKALASRETREGCILVGLVIRIKELSSNIRVKPADTFTVSMTSKARPGKVLAMIAESVHEAQFYNATYTEHNFKDNTSKEVTIETPEYFAKGKYYHYLGYMVIMKDEDKRNTLASNINTKSSNGVNRRF